MPIYMGQLKEDLKKRDQVRWPFIIFGIFLTIAIIIGITFSSVAKDISNGRVAETAFLILGFLVGLGILAILTRYYKRIIPAKDPATAALFAGMILGIVTFAAGIFSVGRVSLDVTSFLAAFATSVMIMGLCIGTMPALQWLLGFQHGVLLRLGVVLFIIARIIELRS